MATPRFDTKNYWLCNTTLTHSKVCLQESSQRRAVNFTTLTMGDSNSHYTDKVLEARQRSPHGRNELDREETKNPRQEWDLGLHHELLRYALHSDKRSTCPPNLSIHNGSNDIVSIALSGQQIIDNDLNNDYHNKVIYKVNNASFQMINYEVEPCW